MLAHRLRRWLNIKTTLCHYLVFTVILPEDAVGPIVVANYSVSSHSSHNRLVALPAQFSLYVHEGGLKPHSFHFKTNTRYKSGPGFKITPPYYVRR